MKYRKIALQYDERLTNEEIRALELFNSLFPKEQISLAYEDRQVTASLREVGINKLETVTRDLAVHSVKPIFSDLLNAILQIGSYGINNGKRNYTEYNQERKVKGRKEKEKTRGRHYYAEGSTFSKQNVTLPADYQNCIIVDDSEAVLQNLPDNCIDLIFTSPPYNFGLEYREDEDASLWEDYFQKLFQIFKQCVRVVKYGGRIAVNVQPLFSDYIPSHHLISNFFIRQKLIWKGEIIWEKNNYNCKYTAWGSWKSPGNPYLKYTWEFIELFCKGDLKKPGSRDNADVSAEEFKKWVVGKWSIAPERNMQQYGHPAMFPEELAERVLKLFSFKGDTVLDPFNGAGTTTAVANRLNRNYLGIDISPDYCEAAERRLQDTEVYTETRL